MPEGLDNDYMAPRGDGKDEQSGSRSETEESEAASFGDAEGNPARSEKDAVNQGIEESPADEEASQ